MIKINHQKKIKNVKKLQYNKKYNQKHNLWNYLKKQKFYKKKIIIFNKSLKTVVQLLNI